MLLWNNIEPPFESVYIKDESIPHDFPASHRDFVYSTMNIDVPADMLDTLGHVTGSIINDGLKKEVSPRIIARRRGKKLSAIVVKDEEQKELSA